MERQTITQFDALSQREIVYELLPDGRYFEDGIACEDYQIGNSYLAGKRFPFDFVNQKAREYLKRKGFELPPEGGEPDAAVIAKNRNSQQNK